jgi:hypothetical protein
MPHSLDFAPILMPAPQAAHYIGVSESKLRDLPIPRRVLGAKRLYLRTDLDAYAFGLPTETADSGGNTCDEVFG